MAQDNLAAAIEGAINYSLAEEGQIDPRLIADQMRREWGSALSVHDFEPETRQLVPLHTVEVGSLIRVFAGDTVILGRVYLKGRLALYLTTQIGVHSIHIPYIWQCEVLEK